MADKPKPSRKIGFTILEPKGPNNPSPEELAARRAEISFKQPVTILEPKGPNNPSPEELAARRAEPVTNGCLPPAPPVVPPAVQTMIVQLADAIGALAPGPRAAAVAELTKRLAG
jgi:hypothetical protein